MPDQSSKIALVAGGSGLVGSHLLAELAAAPEYSRVYAFSRRPLAFEHTKLANRIVSFEALPQLAGVVVHDAFCCLGTTMRDAGSEAAFRKVDVDHVIAFARAARALQAQRFVLMSAVGAAAESRHAYLRAKSDAQRGVAELGFAAVDILQPSLLLGMRRDSRPLEFAAQIFLPLASPLLFGHRAQYRAIGAGTVARAMLGAARSGRRGTNRYTYTALRALATPRPARAPAP